MVRVKLFGLLRLDTGLKTIEADVKSVKELYPMLLNEAKRIKPDTTINSKAIDGCIIIVNGNPAKKNTKLCDGDEIMLMSPVCGG